MITFEQLVKNTQQKFLETSDNIVIKQVGDTWSDDHITCAKFNINGVDVTFHWCGDDIVAAVRYAHESQQARKDVVEHISLHIEGMLEDTEDDQMKFLNLYGVTLDTFKNVSYN